MLQELALELVPMGAAAGVPLVDAAALVGVDGRQRGHHAHPPTRPHLLQEVSRTRWSEPGLRENRG